MSSENGTEAPARIGGLNYDGSRDYGCFQLNDKAHPGFFGTQDWRNPEANARYAYSIYKGRGNFSAWYAVCSPTRVPKYPGIWCN